MSDLFATVLSNNIVQIQDEEKIQKQQAKKFSVQMVIKTLLKTKNKTGNSFTSLLQRES